MKKTILCLLCLLWGMAAGAQENLVRGKRYYENRNYAAALPLLQDAAKEGYGEACYLLGRMYDFGLGVEQNYPIALRMFQRGLEYGYELGESELGGLYEWGDGCTADAQKAFDYYQRSHARGVLSGTFNLARCYYYGKGVAEDNEKAFGMLHALVRNDEFRFDLTGYYRLACRILGECYHKGFGTEVNLKEAVRNYFYSKSPDCLYLAARLVHDNRLPAMGYEYSIKNLMDEAMAGGLDDVQACYDYAAWASEANPDWSLAGIGAESRDAVALFGYLSKAAEAGYGPAQKLLVDWYSQGRGTPVNRLKAKEWYARAKANGEQVPEE